MRETRDCVSLWLRPGRGWPAHLPGQYVRVGVDVDGVRHWRTYSLTSVPRRRDGRIAITVKRIAGGLVSEYLVCHARPGIVVRLAPPTGEFVLPEEGVDALLFVTAGSGVTPIMGMLRALAQRPEGLPDVAHVHISPSSDDAIFGGDLRTLAAGSTAMRCTSTTTIGTVGGTSASSIAACPTGMRARPGRAARPACWTR